MKVNQKPPVFQPVIITLETLAEVVALKEVVSFYTDTSKAEYSAPSMAMADSIKWHMTEVTDNEQT